MVSVLRSRVTSGAFVLLIDFQEPRRLAGCFGHRLRLVGFRSLRDLRHGRVLPARRD
jgi:hypothetical protein